MQNTDSNQTAQTNLTTVSAAVSSKQEIIPITQELIDAQVAKLKALQEKWGITKPSDYKEMNPEQQVFALMGNEGVPSDYTENSIMLASVSKLVINLTLVRSLEEAGELDRIVELNKKALVELFGREVKRFLEQGVYTNFLNQNPNLKGLIERAATPQGQQNLVTLRDEFEDLLPDDITYSVSVEELLYQALTLSSNNANAIAKNLIAEQTDEVEQALRNLVPDYTASPNDLTNLEHWTASLPNVGPLSEHVHVIHSLGQKLQQERLSEAEELVLTSVLNNSQDFGLDFTNSTKGKELRAQGYRIIEKTGYYPSVFWVKDFVEPPFEYPAHMVLATIVSIVPPAESGKKVLSLGYYKLYAVQLPEILTTKEINGVEITFPDDTREYVQQVSEPIKGKVNVEFRRNLEEFVTQML